MKHPYICMSEDNPVYRELLEWAMEEQGIGLDNLIYHESAHEAIEYIEINHESELRQCFFLIDISFDNSDNDGWDIVDSLQKRGYGPIAMLTSSESPKDQEKALSLGAHFILKDMGDGLDISVFTNRMALFLKHIEDAGAKPKAFTD